MAQFYISPYKDKVPRVDADAFVDVSARVIGDVTIEAKASIWPMAVLRADSAKISIKRSTAVLDLVLVEAPEGYPTTINEESIISHGAIIHGATIQNRVLVGMGAIIMDGAVVSSGCIIGAGSLVSPRSHIPPNSMVLGIPGKVVRNTTEEERENILAQVEELYAKSLYYKGL
jgi:carbonic anhydrase/acetyltransferase-like protein (isoleucine patch superfamily)